MLDDAANLLRDGKLVAFPTETVYGLGADATNADAVEKIFAAKGRPPTNPLIIHVAGVVQAKRYARRWPHAARLLAMRFWPGPLTIVLPKMPMIADAATAGSPTVGIRVPDHPLALALLRRFDGPVAAPSANKSNRVSPTTARHVRDELGDAVDLVLDGGPCAVGIESTVVDLCGDVPTILRPGGVTREQIEAALKKPVNAPAGVLTPVGTVATSSGQHAVHYAPRTPAFRFESDEFPRVEGRSTHPAGWILLDSRWRLTRALGRLTGAPQPGRALLPASPAAYARRLYATLRELDGMGLSAIYVEMPPDAPEWAAVRDRVARATRPLLPDGA